MRTEIDRVRTARTGLERRSKCALPPALPDDSVFGFEAQEGPFRYKSTYPPIPLTGLQEELRVGA
jgi:hypothetical protein